MSFFDIYLAVLLAQATIVVFMLLVGFAIEYAKYRRRATWATVAIGCRNCAGVGRLHAPDCPKNPPCGVCGRLHSPNCPHAPDRVAIDDLGKDERGYDLYG